MKELTNKQLHRQDYVDNAIFDLISILNPNSEEIEWNIEIIADVRDAIEQYFVGKNICDGYTFYPYIKE